MQTKEAVGSLLASYLNKNRHFLAEVPAFPGGGLGKIKRLLLETEPSRIEGEMGTVFVRATTEVTLEALRKVCRICEVEVLSDGGCCFVSEEQLARGVLDSTALSVIDEGRASGFLE